MRPVDFGLRGTTAYGRVDPRLDLAPIFRPKTSLPPKQTVVLVGPCGVGKSTVVGEAIANPNREISRDGRGQRELFIVSLTSRRGTAIELQRKLNRLREQQVERNESCVFPETVLYLDADDRSDLWRQGSVVVQLESSHWLFNEVGFHKRINDPNVLLVVWLDEACALMSHLTTSETFKDHGDRWHTANALVKLLVSKAGLLILSCADLEPQFLEPFYALRPPDDVHSPWRVSHFTKPIQDCKVMVVRCERTAMAMLCDKAQHFDVAVADESLEHLEATMDLLQGHQPDTKQLRLTGQTPKLDLLRNLEEQLKTVNAFGYTSALQYGTDASAEHLIDTVFVFIRGAYMHHFDIGQFQARIRHPAHKEIVIFVHPKVFNRPRDERLPETLPDVFEYLNSVQWLNAHALLRYDEDTNEMVAAQPYTRNNFEHHALALTLQRKHQFLNRPLKCLLEHQAARIDFDKGSLFLVRPLPEEPCAEDEKDTPSRALAALDKFERRVRYDEAKDCWFVQGKKAEPLARRLIPLVQQVASTEELRACFGEEPDPVLLGALGGLIGVEKLIAWPSSYLQCIDTQLHFYAMLEKPEIAAKTESSLMCEVSTKLPIGLLRMLARHCGSTALDLLKLDRFAIVEQTLSADEQQFLQHAIVVLPTQYSQLRPPDCWKPKEGQLSAEQLALVTDAALRFGPLRWHGHTRKRWRYNHRAGCWTLSKPAIAQRQLVLRSSFSAAPEILMA